MASGAAQLYADEMLQIPFLTQHGSQQLLADLEYFGNVLAALGVALPPSLVTWEVRGWMGHNQVVPLQLNSQPARVHHVSFHVQGSGQNYGLDTGWHCCPLSAMEA